jgi:hypothetical protein
MDGCLPFEALCFGHVSSSLDLLNHWTVYRVEKKIQFSLVLLNKGQPSTPLDLQQGELGK